MPRAFSTPLLFSLLLAACAKPSSPPSSASTPAAENAPARAQPLVAVKAVSSLTEAVAEISDSALACASDAHCPANVGMLLAADAAGGLDPSSDAVLACTAVLVGDDLVLTNSHCIPGAVKLLPDLCAERVRVVFPGQSAEDSFACGQLLGFSQRETAMSPDLALFRLSRKTGRAPFPLSHEGIQPATTLRSYRVNPDLKSRTGMLVAEPCSATAGSYRMPVYQKAEDPVFVVGDCRSIPGNSGSALVDEHGALRGLLQADLPISEAARAEWLPHLDGADTFAPLAMGTSLGCLSEDQAWKWNTKACGTITENDVVAARPRIRQLLEDPALRDDASSLLLPFLQQSVVVQWRRMEIRTTALERTETLAPGCLKANWDRGFRAANGLDVPETAELTAQLPRISLSLRFNRYLQLTTPRAKLEGMENATYRFSPRLALSGRAELVREDERLVLSNCDGT